MARRDFRRGAAAIAQKRLTTWLFFQPTIVVSTATGGTIVGVLNAAALALRPFTIIRTRVELTLRSDQAAAVETQICCFGLAVVSDQAAAIGVSAVPTPFTDMQSDHWLLHQIIYGDESNLTDRTRSATRKSVDSKAMRKVNVGEDLVIVQEFATGSNGFSLTSGGRILIKLH